MPRDLICSTFRAETWSVRKWTAITLVVVLLLLVGAVALQLTVNR
jgi:autotransporter translocation and assembly factor TamB